jgi:DNA helicase HerA-like ATPase
MEVRMTRGDRLRHFYVIGQTGTGKSGTLLGMVAQDMANGDGLCYIDPHGSDVQTILSWVPEHRIDDVIYFDPAYMPRPMGLNMLEYDQSRPEQKTLIIDELMEIFNQLFDMKAQGGAMFQQYFKNSAFLVMDHPESGNTLLEITRVLADKSFRDMKLSHCTNPIVRQFWISAEKTTGDQSLANFVPYISSKFDPLISNEILRPVITQEKSAFNMRDIMDNKKILLVNLSKGRLGNLNANLLGLILVGKIQMAALSRAESHGVNFPDFYLYIDEFQNITTPSISSILSEARKYKLSLHVAHQFMAQLSDDIKKAVLGNVGNMQIFRISSEDAEALQPRVDPIFKASDIMKLDNRNAYMSMLINGSPVPAFNIRTPDWPPQRKEIIDSIKELSYLKYGRPREEVEGEIMAKYEEIMG